MAFQGTNLVVGLDNPTRKLFENLTDDHWRGLWYALIGGVIGIVAGYVMFLVQEARKKDLDDEFEKNILHAICCEIRMLLSLHKRGVGDALKQLPEGKPFNMYLHISQNFFTVFEANASHIGKIAPSLSKTIVELYLVMKAMIEDLAVNKSMLDRLRELSERIRHLPVESPQFKEDETSFKFYQEAMIKQASRLRTNDAMIHSLAADLMRKYDSMPVKKSCSVRFIRILVRAARGL